MQRLNALRQHRDAVLALAHQHGVHGLRVFGSVAQGDARPDSAIDFLISGMDEGKDLIDFIEFKHDLEKLLHCPVDVIGEKGLYWYLRDKILAEAVAL